MKIRDSTKDTNGGEETDAGMKKMSAEFSIFSTILADIEENPMILQKQKNLTAEFSVFSTILADIDGENLTILENTNKMLKETQRSGSIERDHPLDFTCTVSQTLTRSNIVDILNQELKTLRSEMEINGQTSDRLVSCHPVYDRECACVEEGKVEQREEVRFVVDEVIEWLLRVEIESEISTVYEDSVCKVEDVHTLGTLDEMLSTMLGNEDELVKNTERCGQVDEFIDEMLEEVETDGSYLDCIKDTCVFGAMLENLLVAILREKAEKEEKEVSSWISNGEPEIETGIAEEKKEVKRDIQEKKKMMTPVVINLERTEQESTATKRDCIGYKRRLYLIEKLRERHNGLMKRRRKAVRFGVELSFLLAEFMLLIPNVILAGETRDYSMCTKLLRVNEDDKCTSVIIGKLEAVFGILIWKKENKEHDVNLPESIFRYDDFIRLCANATRVLGKIVWDMKRNQCERLKLPDLDSLFEDCEKVLMKIELKVTEMRLTEMKRRVYRSVSADYKSFSKSERSDRSGRSMIGSYVVDIWKSLFQAEPLQEH